MKHKASRNKIKSSSGQRTPIARPGFLHSRDKAIEFAENCLFGFFILCLAAAFSVNLQEHFTLPKLLIFRCGALVLCSVLLLRLCLGQLPGMMPRWITVSGVVLVFWWLVSSFLAVHLPTAMHGFQGRYNGLLNQLISLFIFFAFALSRLSLKRIELLLKLLVMALLPVVLYAILQHFNIDPYHWPMKRPAATMGHPVLLAATLGLAIPFLIYFFLTTQSVAKKILGWLCLTVFASAVFITLSRGPWIGIAFSMLLLVTVAIRQKYLDWKKLGIAVGVVIVAFLSLYSVNSESKKGIDDRLKSLLSPTKDVSIMTRFVYYDAAKRMILDRPLMGAGFENFRVLYPSYRLAKDTSPNIIPTMVHNMYIERAVSNGIPGLLLYLIFVSTIIFSLVKATVNIPADGKTKLFLFSFLASISGYLIQELSGWQDVSLSAFFWIIAGLSVNASYQATRTANSTTQHNLAWQHNFKNMLTACLVVSLGGLLYLVFDAARKVKVDSIFWRAERMNPVDEWSELEPLTQIGVENEGSDYYYQDKAGLIYTKRFAATGTPEAYSKALQLFEQAYKHNPFDSYIVLHALELDAIALRSGVIQRPSPLTERGIRVLPDIDRNNPQLLETIGKFYTQAKNYPEALKWLDKLRVAGNTGVSADLLEGEIARGMGDTNRALQILRKAARKMEQNNSYDQQWVNAKLVVTSIEMEKKLTDSALQGTLDVSERFPREVRAYLLRGDIYAIKNNLPAARDSYKEALAVEPTNQFAKRGFEAADQLVRRSQ